MKIEMATGDLGSTPCDALVVSVFSESLGPAAQSLDERLQGVIQRLVESEEIRGRAGEVVKLLGHDSVAPVVVLLGLGKREDLNPTAVRRAAGAAAKELSQRPRGRVEFHLDLDDPALETAALYGAAVGCVGVDLHRDQRQSHAFETLAWKGLEASALLRAAIISESSNVTRQLVNQPANVIFPESFVELASQAVQSAGLEVEVWDETRLAEERCNSLLAVARGSAKAPRLMISRHHGAGADAPWLALVGKGVTFDSGGLSLKPSESMKHMKCDMAGAATVVGAMQAIGRLNLPINVVGLCGLVENMISDDAYRLGDVLTARNGRTIEVLNTDAEGRLVLADVLDVAVEIGATRIVDLATLTGACVVALGHEAAAIMTNDCDWRQQVQQAAEAAGERVWELPMYDEYGEQIRSEIADIKNIGAGRWGGAITAAKFLEEFVGDVPWTHIDIAGAAFLDTKQPWQASGATGAMVPTLVELAALESS